LIATTTLYQWAQILADKGLDALLTAYEPGPVAGGANKKKNRRKLDEHQESVIQYYLDCYKPSDPDCGSLNSANWDRKAIQYLISYIFNVSMCLTTVGNYLKRWGYTPQRPSKKAYEQDPEAVIKFTEETYPSLVKKCRKEKGIIIALDETGVNNTCHFGRSYALRGKKTTIDLSSKKFSENICIAMSDEGHFYYMTYEQSMNAKLYIKFLDRLIKNLQGRKIFLLADNMKVHHAKLINEWHEGKDDLIEFYYFPAYSPHLNPVEYINNYVKSQMYSMKPMRCKEDLSNRINSVLRSIQRKSRFVKKIYDHELLNYMKI
jgi:transposase